MRRVAAFAVAVGVAAGAAPAGPTYTPLQGTYGEPFDNGDVHGLTFEADPVAGMEGNIYDNIEWIFGGAATQWCPIPGKCPQRAFADWIAPSAQWGDDLHGLSQAGTGPAVVTQIRYGYANVVATATHVIKLYDMVPPSVVPHDTTTIAKGALLTSIVIAGNPTGEFIVTVTGLGFQVPPSAAWIKFEESGPGFPETMWLTGAYGGIGFSHPGVTYTVKSSPDTYNLWLPFPSFYFTNVGYVASNIQVALGGFHVPAPAAIGLLALGGLVTLRRGRPRP